MTHLAPEFSKVSTLQKESVNFLPFMKKIQPDSKQSIQDKLNNG